MEKHTVKVGNLNLGGDNPLFLMGGPCVIEDKDNFTLSLALSIKEICQRLEMPFIFKSSYEKANRTSVGSEQGPGLTRGLEILAEVKSKLEVPIICDVHTPEQAPVAAQVADVLQIPAFLCRQTKFIQAVANTGKVVNVKKGQFLAPANMKNVVEKVRSTGNEQILLTERGACFGYNNLVVDMRSFPIMAKLGFPVIFDGTHSVQLPSTGNETGGEREFIRPLVCSAVAAGVDGLFLEIHPEPEKAPCDSASMLPLDQLEKLLQEALAIRKAIKPFQ